MSFSLNRNFFLDVAMGKVPGFTAFNKFGENPDVDTGTDPMNLIEDANFTQLFPEYDFGKDIEGNARLQGENWDIGPYEFQGKSCVDTPTLLNYISQWKAGSISIPVLISRIANWKSGTGC